MKNHLLAIAILPFLSAACMADNTPVTSLDGNHTLQLKNSSSRDYFYITDAYTSSIYNDQSSAGIQRLELTVKSDLISGRGVGISLYDAITIATEWEHLAKLESRLNALVKMLDTRLQQGDSIVIEYTPGRGSEVIVKNEYMGIIQGHDWFNALTQASMTTKTPLDTQMLQAQTRQLDSGIAATIL
ncbi:chalcone isomerase family protein [Candidatus Thalassolituus haligoni]|uniref:chalcone isomerase family protein n=1 Tax=Candidatus Thalassolituus haligoni TaxID=3100113 RepID=UPI0035198DE3|tara:strand:+ start:24468 stop:25025 length:558 start_codon:yes stop_codon:yes gene_type:complete